MTADYSHIDTEVLGRMMQVEFDKIKVIHFGTEVIVEK